MSFLKGLLKYSGILMLCGWMFFVGVLVGRGTAPVEFDTGWFQERLAVVFDDSQPEKSVTEKPELDFYAALQKRELKDDYDLKIKKGQPSEKDAKEESDESTVEIASGDQQVPLIKSRKGMTTKAARQMIAAAASKAGEESETVLLAGGIKRLESVSKSDRLPAAASSSDSARLSEIKSEQVKQYADTVYSYTIQIASFKSEADAQSHIDKLAQKGYTAYKSSGLVGESTWYRIRIGSYSNITEAKAGLKKLEESGIKGLIIQKD